MTREIIVALRKLELDKFRRGGSSKVNRFILNVALDGWHYCRVELPDTNEAAAVDKAKLIRRAFGAKFECSLTCWNDVGKKVEMQS